MLPAVLEMCSCCAYPVQFCAVLYSPSAITATHPTMKLSQTFFCIYIQGDNSLGQRCEHDDGTVSSSSAHFVNVTIISFQPNIVQLIEHKT